MRLKSQRQLMIVAIAVLALLAAALAAVLANRPAPREMVPLGKAAVSVEAMRPAAMARTAPAQTPASAAATGRDIGSGQASYYGGELAGNRTATGERFDPEKLTAAHRTLPLGSRVRVTNPGNGKSVVVRINDRGPFHGNRAIDLSLAAAREIGLIRMGVGQVRMAILLD
jgi:rare lipoprotein A (peptidoglycan hydrolase)